MLDAKRAADASSILAFLEAPISASFDLAAEDAIGYFSSKGMKESFSYADMTAEAHQHAFTVAKMMDVDLLGQVRASLEDALANGVTFKDWGDTLLPTLQAAGWWGKQDMIDPLTGKTILAQLGSPSRLETIFRTNMQTSYAVGQWREIESQQDIAPLLMYDAVDDFRTRPLHRAWHKKVLPVAHAWWKTHYPPNGWNCRCGVIQISEDEAEAMGLKVSAKAPAGGNYTWKNPRTGKSESIPKGLDPGFNHNAGAAYLKDLQNLLGEKVAALPPSLQKAAAEGVEKAAKAAEAQAAVAAAQQALAKAEANAALARAQAKANEAAKNAAAQAKLDQLESGKNPVLGDGLKKEALKALAKTDALDGLTATEKLAAVELKAAEIKLIKDTSANLSLYKKAILEGKNPQPAWVKSFNSLDEEKKAAFLAKIDAEKAAATAAKAAEQASQAAATGAPVQGKAKTMVDGAPPDPATMTVTGRKTKGGTDGAFYTDTATGQRWLVKFNGSADAVQNEVLAGRLYSLAGVEAPELHAINIDGKPHSPAASSTTSPRSTRRHWRQPRA
jgi:SPP1 gp7 family putative phage head morphogenesis protein